MPSGAAYRQDKASSAWYSVGRGGSQVGHREQLAGASVPVIRGSGPSYDLPDKGGGIAGGLLAERRDAQRPQLLQCWRLFCQCRGDLREVSTFAACRPILCMPQAGRTAYTYSRNSLSSSSETTAWCARR